MSDFDVEWNGAIICLSIGIAFIGSYAAITLCEQFRLCSKENQPKLLSKQALMWLMAASLGGVAIW
jgi:NO-binding membrane sensor protein with MHYT domain